MFELSIVCVAIIVSLCELGQYTQELASYPGPCIEHGKWPGDTHRTRKMARAHAQNMENGPGTPGGFGCPICAESAYYVNDYIPYRMHSNSHSRWLLMQALYR